MSRSASEAFCHNRESYERLYRGEPAFPGAPAPAGIPWDVGQAQPRLMELEALGAVSGEVLDAGCGLGDNTIYLARRGYSVTGFDSSPTAIEQARARAAAAGARVPAHRLNTETRCRANSSTYVQHRWIGAALLNSGHPQHGCRADKHRDHRDTEQPQTQHQQGISHGRGSPRNRLTRYVHCSSLTAATV